MTFRNADYMSKKEKKKSKKLQESYKKISLSSCQDTSFPYCLVWF